MNINSIPLILLNFNQLTYLKNIINWWWWCYPNNSIVVIDNNSDYEPLLKYYKSFEYNYGITIGRYPENTCAQNLASYLAENKPEFYAISDVDIMPAPNVPPNFLEIFLRRIEEGFHHAGFQLIIDDLPSWTNKREEIIFNEGNLRNNPFITTDGYKT